MKKKEAEERDRVMANATLDRVVLEGCSGRCQGATTEGVSGKCVLSEGQQE